MAPQTRNTKIPNTRRAHNSSRALFALHTLDASRASSSKRTLCTPYAVASSCSWKASGAARAGLGQLCLDILLQEVDFLLLMEHAPNLLVHELDLVRDAGLPISFLVLYVSQPVVQGVQHLLNVVHHRLRPGVRLVTRGSRAHDRTSHVYRYRRRQGPPVRTQPCAQNERSYGTASSFPANQLKDCDSQYYRTCKYQRQSLP